MGRLSEPGHSQTVLRGIIWLALIYVVCGSAYKYQTMGARGMDMLPHIGFWMEYPRLVVDGITYVQILLGQAVGKNVSGGGGGSGFGGSGFGGSSFGGGSGFQPMGSDRDSFAHFEPTR